MKNFSFADLLKQADEIVLRPELNDGWHRCKIISSEIKQTKAGTGMYIAFQFRTEKGHLIYDNVNVQNLNQTAVNIGLAHLKALKLATGVVTGDSPQVFVGKVVDVLLKTNKDGEQKVVNFRSVSRPPELSKVVAVEPEPEEQKDDSSSDFSIF